LAKVTKSIVKKTKQLFDISLFSKYEQAVITHFLQNYNDGLPECRFEEAKAIVKKYSNEEIDYSNRNLLSENPLQQLLFDLDNVPFPAPTKNSFKFIDLFAGVGGFRIAMQRKLGKCVFSSEWNEKAQLTYKANFGEVPFGDISLSETKEYIPDNFDVLCAGFPCQPFSIAGNRKGFSDTRGTLFFDIERIIDKHHPQVVFLENVKNFISHDKGNTFKIIKEILETKLQYKLYYKVLNTMTHANIPQNRERIFMVAFHKEKVPKHIDFKFPEPIKLSKSIHDVLEKGRLNDYYYYKSDHRYFPILDKEMVSKDTVYQWRRVYVRENKNNVCPTLTANMGTGGHNVPLIRDKFGIRKLTPRECFLFQGYPEDFVLPDIARSQLYLQAGNTITLPLVERISEEIIKIL